MLPTPDLTTSPTSQLTGSLFLGFTLTVFLYILYKGSRVLRAHYTSSLRNIPGPPSSSLVFGNYREINAPDASERLEGWIERYGKLLRIRTVFNAERLCTFDTKALDHVLTYTLTWRRPERSRFSLSTILGEGIFVVEGEKHHQQRRIMSPAFGPAQIRELTGIFFETALELRDIWRNSFTQDSGNESTTIEISSWIGRATIDMIGLAAFNYEFKSLTSPGQDELQEAFENALSFRRIPLLTYAQAYIPLLRHPLFQSRSQKAVADAQRRMREIGTRIVEEKKTAIADSSCGTVDKDSTSMKSKDLLTCLLRANMAGDLPENQRMSDQDVVAQIPSILIAGHETTSAATIWCLFALAQHGSVQTKLREELLSLPIDTPAMEELNSLPYLDAVVREVLRLYAPVTMTNRTATEDDIIPLNAPYVDSKGQTHEHIRVKKGTTILLHILAFNRCKDIWGEDALVFRPERWTESSESSSHIPGVWGHILSFLSGPHSCLGYRFALIEIKRISRKLLASSFVPCSEVNRVKDHSFHFVCDASIACSQHGIQLLAMIRRSGFLEFSTDEEGCIITYREIEMHKNYD